MTALAYLVSAVCFVLGLRLMNSPATARRGNQLSAGGMLLAVAVTVWVLIDSGRVSATGWIVVGAGTVVGSLFGWYAARTVAMTAMPQLVSLFNAVGGGAAALRGKNDQPPPGRDGGGWHDGEPEGGSPASPV